MPSGMSDDSDAAASGCASPGGPIERGSAGAVDTIMEQGNEALAAAQGALYCVWC